MEMKKALLLFAFLGVFASGFGAESRAGVKPALLPSMKRLVRGGAEVEEAPQAVHEKRSAELKQSGQKDPLNVILLMVDELYRSDAMAYLENSAQFPIRGHLLQTCPDISVTDSCDCDEKLGANIASLISWAQRANMSTSGLYEIPTSLSDPRARLVYRARREVPWLLQTGPSSKNAKPNIASKLEDKFFRSLVNGLTTAQLPEPSVVYQSNVAELTSSFLQELSSNPNKHGHLAIVRIGVHGLPKVPELIKRYISAPNTLTVFMNTCPRDLSNAVPFFTCGSGSEQLSRDIDLKRLDELPSAIRNVIDQYKIIDQSNVEAINPDSELIFEDFINLNDRRYRRQPTGGGNGANGALPSSAAPNTTTEASTSGQETAAQSTMMTVTVVTAIVACALKV